MHYTLVSEASPTGSWNTSTASQPTCAQIPGAFAQHGLRTEVLPDAGLLLFTN